MRNILESMKNSVFSKMTYCQSETQQIKIEVVLHPQKYRLKLKLENPINYLGNQRTKNDLISTQFIKFNNFLSHVKIKYSKCDKKNIDQVFVCKDFNRSPGSISGFVFSKICKKSQ
jgi:hypothetical protein